MCWELQSAGRLMCLNHLYCSAEWPSPDQRREDRERWPVLLRRHLHGGRSHQVSPLVCLLGLLRAESELRFLSGDKSLTGPCINLFVKIQAEQWKNTLTCTKGEIEKMKLEFISVWCCAKTWALLKGGFHCFSVLTWFVIAVGPFGCVISYTVYNHSFGIDPVNSQAFPAYSCDTPAMHALWFSRATAAAELFPLLLSPSLGLLHQMSNNSEFPSFLE